MWKCLETPKYYNSSICTLKFKIVSVGIICHDFHDLQLRENRIYIKIQEVKVSKATGWYFHQKEWLEALRIVIWRTFISFKHSVLRKWVLLVSVHSVFSLRLYVKKVFCHDMRVWELNTNRKLGTYTAEKLIKCMWKPCSEILRIYLGIWPAPLPLWEI